MKRGRIKSVNEFKGKRGRRRNGREIRERKDVPRRKLGDGFKSEKIGEIDGERTITRKESGSMKAKTKTKTPTL